MAQEEKKDILTLKVGDKKIVEETKNEIPQWAKELQEQVSTLKKENEMLKDIAGNNTIKSYVEGNAPKAAKKAYFKVWDNKLVVGWDKLDYSRFNPKAADGLTENILTTLLLEDGNKVQVNYVMFNNFTERVFLEVVKQVGDLTTVVMPDGKQLTVETKFLNR